MKRNSFRISVCAKGMLGALALSVVSVCYASSTTLVGGGSMVPAIGYVGESTTSLVYPAGTGSLFGVFSTETGNPSVSYCETTDGVALAVFTGSTIGGTSGISVQGTCPTKGFGAGTVGRASLTQPDYIVLDSPLSASGYLDYQYTHLNSAGTTATGYPVQFPAIAASIAIAFNLNDSLGNPVTSAEANFSDTQICGMLDGTYTTWNEVASAFTLPDGGVIPSTPINVQYRSDGNGTTFGLSNHLAAVCGEIDSTYFEANQTFTSVVANFFPSGVPSGNGTSTPKWSGFSTNASVAEAIASTVGSFGYVETANTLASNPTLPLADVNGLSPTTNFGSPLTITASDVVYNEVINTADASNGTPQLEMISSISGVIDPPTTQCIALVPPSLYAKSGVRTGLITVDTYPIVAVTYLLANSDGNAADLAGVRGLMTAPFNSAITSQVTTVGTGKGLALLSLGSEAFTASQISGCLVN
jgi:phosphate transport system substrate-binding protein